MATQIGILKLTGMFDNLVFYEAFGKQLVKRKGGFDVEKERKNPEMYKLKLRSEGNFKRASKLVSSMYRTLPREMKVHGFFGSLVAIANKVLHNEGSEEEVVLKIREMLGGECGKM